MKTSPIAIIIVAFLCLAGFFALYSPKTVPAGYVGVKVYLLGGSKGVDSEEVGVGRYWLTMNEDLYLFPTFTQNDSYDFTNNQAIPFNDIDGTSLKAPIGISYRVNPEKVNVIFQKFRRGIEEISDSYIYNNIKNLLNNEAGKLRVEYIYGQGKEEILKKVQDQLKAIMSPVGIEVESLYWNGTIQVPDTIMAALNAKIEANQKAAQRQNEVATAKAEADKAIEAARGKGESILVEAKKQAEANDVLAKSLTKELIEYRKLENEVKAIEKWGGTLPQYMGGGSPVPFINVTPNTEPAK